jgi:hypothetical protein
MLLKEYELDSLMFGLIGMVVGFIAIYIFIAKKVDMTDHTSEIQSPKSKIISKISETKSGISSLRKKSKIIHLFKTLSKKDQKELLGKLNTQLIKQEK